MKRSYRSIQKGVDRAAKLKELQAARELEAARELTRELESARELDREVEAARELDNFESTREIIQSRGEDALKELERNRDIKRGRKQRNREK